MPIFEGGQNFTVSGTFLDQSQTHIHAPGNNSRGFKELQNAAVQQAIHDSSECNKPGCFPGTREEHIRTITSWGKGEWKSENAQVLWLHGPAGVGKSALAQTCASDIGKNVVAATFFFNRPNNWNNPTSFLPTISYQLATCCEAYRNLVSGIIDRDPFILKKSIPVQFRELLVAPLAKLRASDQGIFESCLIIVDGLDECDHPDVIHTQCNIIQTILASVHQRTTPFLWAIFSRPESHIQAAFSSEQDRQIIWELTLPVSSNADKDIRAYLEDGFRTIRARYHLSPSTRWPSDEALDQLVKQSAGLFIYSSNAIRYIGDDRNLPVGPEERLKAVLKLRDAKSADSHNPFVHLDAFYILIMEQIPPAILPITIVYISTYINSDHFLSDLEVLQFCSILDLSLSAFYEAINKLHSVLTVKESPSGIPTGLSFYHASFTEFLWDVERSTEKFCVNIPDVYRHCVSTIAETLSRLSRYNNQHELGTVLISNLSSSHSMELDIYVELLGNLIPLMAIRNLFQNFKRMTADPEVSVLTHLLAINWKFGIGVTGNLSISSDEVEAFSRKIPKAWRSKIIRPPRRKFLDALRQKFGLMEKDLKCYVLGSGANKALLKFEPRREGYCIEEYSSDGA